MKLSSTFRKVSTTFATEFTDLAKEIDHPVLSGESREHALTALLQKYLPQRVGVSRGIVIDAHGAESRQQDVVIYDRTVGTVFEINSIRHFPCESVIAVGEVKANITSVATLTDALEKIRSVKTLDRSNGGQNKITTGPGISLKGVEFNPSKNHRDQILGFVFTSSSLAKETLLERIQSYNAQHPRTEWMNLFCDFKKYLVSYECDSLYPSAMDAKYLYCTKESEVPDLLLLFYCILATFVEEAHVARPLYFSYGDIASTGATYHELTRSTV
jgi:hypothetical protein